MRTFVYPYKRGSRSAKALAQALGCKQIKLENSRYRPRPTDVIINWGASSLNFVPYRAIGTLMNMLNHHDDVARCSNKLEFFWQIEEYNSMADSEDDSKVSIPEWCTGVGDAMGWQDEGHTVVVRHVLNGHSGQGIEVVPPYRGIPLDAPLYVKYIPKKEEYRVHVVANEVIHVQRKARNREVPDDQVNWKVRNLDGGFIYKINDLDIPECVTDQALRAVNAIGLDFGAVDVIWNQHENKAYVLEINTAPGLTGTTLDKYKEAFNEYINKLEN